MNSGLVEILQLLEDSSTDSSESSSSFLSDSDSGEEVEHHKTIKTFNETVRGYSDADFKKHFRLNRSTTKRLIDMYSQADVFKNKFIRKGGCKRIEAEKEMYIFVWYMANTEPYRTIANLFGISSYAAWKIVSRVCNWIISISHRFVKWPEDLEGTARDFEARCGIPGVIGAVDGTDIHIRAPVFNKECFFNRKRFYSIKLQAVVGANKRFFDVFCGEPGSMHDSRMLRRSPLYRRMHTNGNVFGSNFFIIGDSAYPCLDWLVTPFKDNGHLTQRQGKFNYLHSCTRIPVEHSFGLLKTRFRRLQFFTEHQNLNCVVNLVVAGCTLHNICICYNDIVLEENSAQINTNDTETSRETAFATNRRDELFQELIDNHVL